MHKTHPRSVPRSTTDMRSVRERLAEAVPSLRTVAAALAVCEDPLDDDAPEPAWWRVAGPREARVLEEIAVAEGCGMRARLLASQGVDPARG